MQLQKDFAKCSHWKQGWRTFLFSPLVSSTSRVFSTDFSATSSPVRFSYARALWSAEPAEEVQIRGFTSIVVGVIAVHIPPRISPNSSDFLMVSCRIVRKKILEIDPRRRWCTRKVFHCRITWKKHRTSPSGDKFPEIQASNLLKGIIGLLFYIISFTVDKFWEI